MVKYRALMNMRIHSRMAVGIILSAAAFSVEAASERVTGSGLGGYSQWATDQYPGFDGLDTLPVPEKKEKGWVREWLGIGAPDGATASGQLSIARRLETDGEYKDAVRAYDILVREWPASAEASEAQYRMAKVLEMNLGEYADAYEEYAYLLDFYPGACPYADVVEAQYRIVNLLHDTRRVFLGMSFTGNRELRQSYERIVRRAPGAAYVPDAMLKIAELREQDTDYEEALKVYSSLRSRYPGTKAARVALYREASARMWLVRRLAYNLPRCKDTESYLKLAVKNDPSHPNVEELRLWLRELSDYLAKDAWQRAKFYDTRMRTRRAAVAAYEKFIAEHPESSHADEARARIAALKDGNREEASK